MVQVELQLGFNQVGDLRRRKMAATSCFTVTDPRIVRAVPRIPARCLVRLEHACAFPILGCDSPEHLKEVCQETLAREKILPSLVFFEVPNTIFVLARVEGTGADESGDGDEVEQAYWFYMASHTETRGFKTPKPVLQYRFYRCASSPGGPGDRICADLCDNPGNSLRRFASLRDHWHANLDQYYWFQIDTDETGQTKLIDACTGLKVWECFLRLVGTKTKQVIERRTHRVRGYVHAAVASAALAAVPAAVGTAVGAAAAWQTGLPLSVGATVGVAMGASLQNPRTRTAAVAAAVGAGAAALTGAGAAGVGTGALMVGALSTPTAGRVLQNAATAVAHQIEVTAKAGAWMTVTWVYETIRVALVPRVRVRRPVVHAQTAPKGFVAHITDRAEVKNAGDAWDAQGEGRWTEVVGDVRLVADKDRPERLVWFRRCPLSQCPSGGGWTTLVLAEGDELAPSTQQEMVQYVQRLERDVPAPTMRYDAVADVYYVHPDTSVQEDQPRFDTFVYQGQRRRFYTLGSDDGGRVTVTDADAQFLVVVPWYPCAGQSDSACQASLQDGLRRHEERRKHPAVEWNEDEKFYYVPRDSLELQAAQVPAPRAPSPSVFSRRFWRRAAAAIPSRPTVMVETRTPVHRLVDDGAVRQFYVPSEHQAVWLYARGTILLDDRDQVCDEIDLYTPCPGRPESVSRWHRCTADVDGCPMRDSDRRPAGNEEAEGDEEEEFRDVEGPIEARIPEQDEYLESQLNAGRVQKEALVAREQHHQRLIRQMAEWRDERQQLAARLDRLVRVATSHNAPF